VEPAARERTPAANGMAPKDHAAAHCAVAGVTIAICWALTAYNLNLRPYKACIPINRHTIASTQGGMHIRARATVLADQGAACLTPGGGRWPTRLRRS
jgi:hypothetical protein